MNATRICSVEGCDGARYCRGWCAAHYQRWRQHGDPNHGGIVVRATPRGDRTAECRIDGCTALSAYRNLCMKHYTRVRRHGDPEFNHLNRTPIERFMAFVEKRADGCWCWTGAIDVRGYPHFQTTKRVRAHRWLYEQMVGPIPEGLTLDHLCRRPSCVNPAHMEPVTREENTRREHAARRAR